jgi:hypothetical protein
MNEITKFRNRRFGDKPRYGENPISVTETFGQVARVAIRPYPLYVFLYKIFVRKSSTVLQLRTRQFTENTLSKTTLFNGTALNEH